MKRIFYILISLFILLFWSSCRKNFEFAPSTGNLYFERDTIYLDTVFTNIGSSTYNLKVYNKSNDDIVIPTISLKNGADSFYRMNIDGTTGSTIPSEIGKVFNEVELLANDSLFIFIETTIDISTLTTLENQFLYTDRILFDTGINQQHVDLVTLVKDAVFIFPERNDNNLIKTLTFDVDGDGSADETNITGRFLATNELDFNSEKPYVIFGYAAVGNEQILSMEPGTRVYFHADSGIIVTAGGSIQINGDLSIDQVLLENEVVLEGNRLEPAFSDVPGQWGAVWLLDGSINNTIKYATIKNATVGVLVEGNQNAPTNKLTITNSQIYNASNYGILGKSTSILAENLVINNCGQSSFAGIFGGKYNFTHCTLGNYWSNSFRDFPTVMINDFDISQNGEVFNSTLDEANFNNCIIYGNNNPELLLENQNMDFNFKFTNCLIRFDNSFLEGTGNYQFGNSQFYENNVFNADPDFENPFENKLRIGQNSVGKEKGNSTFANQVPFDILGESREANPNPDIGAYQSTVFDE